MSTQKELIYLEYVQRENDLYHAPYAPELSFYSAVQTGNISRVKSLLAEPFKDKTGLGILSRNPLQNMKYHFAITAAMLARYCIEGGLEPSDAYTLSDLFIQKADLAKSIEEISDLHSFMCLDYTKKMEKLHTHKINSKPVAECIDYIYNHLHTQISLTTLAGYVNVSSSYLSRLFKQETGSTLSNYIQDKKIETAKNMLLHSDYTPSEISSTLAFSSQSYFTEIFRKKTGYTPTAYRKANFRNLL